MTRTVKEWLDFLNMGDNHYVGLEMENGVKCKYNDYLPIKQCLVEYEPWFNEIVVNCYIVNQKLLNGQYRHLLIYSENEE